AAEHLALHFGADERHTAAKPRVVFLEKASAGLRLLAPHRAVARRAATNEKAGLPAPVEDRPILHEPGADVLDERQFSNRHHIVGGDAYALARALAAHLHAGLAGPHDDGAVGKRTAEAGIERAAEAVAVSEEHDDGNY